MEKQKKGVRLEHISKIYTDPKTGKEFYAVQDTTLDIEPGSFVTLLGPSGCGKTTPLRMIAGFESPDEGDIYLGDEAINALTPNKRDTAMVFQSYALLPHYNVFDNVAYGLRIRKLPKEEIHERVMNILKLVEMEGMESRMTNQLSGGQQQRVALARAIVIHPEVLLMDEPLSNLDAKLRVEMRNAIKRIQQQVGITTIYVTHDQEEALAVSDRIAVMNGGVIQQIDTPKNVYQRPSNIFVSTFIGLSNIMDGRIEARDGQTLLHIGDYSVPMENLSRSAQDGQAVKVSIRPEEFIISREDSGGIPAVVRSSVFLGITTHYFVETADGREMEVIQNSDIWDIIPDHTPIRLGVQPHKINVFTEDGSQSLIVRRDHS